MVVELESWMVVWKVVLRVDVMVAELAGLKVASWVLYSV